MWGQRRLEPEANCEAILLSQQAPSCLECQKCNMQRINCKDNFSVIEHFHLKLPRNQKYIVRQFLKSKQTHHECVFSGQQS